MCWKEKVVVILILILILWGQKERKGGEAPFVWGPINPLPTRHSSL